MRTNTNYKDAQEDGYMNGILFLYMLLVVEEEINSKGTILSNFGDLWSP